MGDGSNPFSIASGDLSHVVVNGPGSVTQVTVTVRMRKAGIYISNTRVDVISEVFNSATNSYDSILN